MGWGGGCGVESALRLSAAGFWCLLSVPGPTFNFLGKVQFLFGFSFFLWAAKNNQSVFLQAHAKATHKLIGYVSWYGALKGFHLRQHLPCKNLVPFREICSGWATSVDVIG